MTIEEENKIINKIPDMTKNGLYLAFYLIWKEVGDYHINKWLKSFREGT